MIAHRPGLARAGLVRAEQPVLAPRQGHRRAEHRQVHIANHRPVLDLRTGSPRGAEQHHVDQFDQQLHLRAAALIRQHPHVLQTHQGLDDLARLMQDEGVTGFVGHTSKTAAPSSPSARGTPTQRRPPRRVASPLRSEDPDIALVAPRMRTGMVPSRSTCGARSMPGRSYHRMITSLWTRQKVP